MLFFEAVMAILELTMWARLPSISEICLSLPTKALGLRTQPHLAFGCNLLGLHKLTGIFIRTVCYGTCQ